MTPTEFIQSPPKHYSDWFGSGNTRQDYLEAVKDSPSAPVEVRICDFMLYIRFADGSVMVTGYDGNEYLQTFVFEV